MARYLCVLGFTQKRVGKQTNFTQKRVGKCLTYSSLDPVRLFASPAHEIVCLVGDSNKFWRHL